MTDNAAATPQGSTRRIIMDGTTGRSGLEIERSHIEGKVARLTATIGGDGVILHLSAIELERLLAAALRLRLLVPANPSATPCKHCGAPIKADVGAGWLHIGAAGNYWNCGDTVTSGTVATPPSASSDSPAKRHTRGCRGAFGLPCNAACLASAV